MARIAFFTLYGGIVGAAFSSLLLYLNPNHRAVAAVVGVAGSILYGLAARKLAKDSRTTIAGGLIAVPLLPVGLIGVAFGLAAALFLMMAAFPFAVAAAAARDRRQRAKLNLQGRLISFGQLEQRLTAGEGALIEEWGPHGLCRVWWTADDLLAKGLPRASDAVFFAIVDGEAVAWHSAYVKKYLDGDVGRASLVRHGFRRISKLRRLFPDARIALMAPSFIDAEPPPNKPDLERTQAARPSITHQGPPPCR